MIAVVAGEAGEPTWLHQFLKPQHRQWTGHQCAVDISKNLLLPCQQPRWPAFALCGWRCCRFNLGVQVGRIVHHQLAIHVMPRLMRNGQQATLVANGGKIEADHGQRHVWDQANGRRFLKIGQQHRPLHQTVTHSQLDGIQRQAIGECQRSTHGRSRRCFVAMGDGAQQHVHIK